MSDNAAEGRREHEPGGSDEPADEGQRPSERRPGEVRVGAVEAAVAAGLVAPSEPPRSPTEEPPASSRPDTSGYELPDWSDPPTGQVPKVLLDPGDDGSARVPGPTWRQSAADWEADEDTLGFLVQQGGADEAVGDDSAAIAGKGEDPTGENAPFEFDLSPATRHRRLRRDDGKPVGRRLPEEESGAAPGDDQAWSDVVRRRHRHRRPAVHRAHTAEVPKRNTAVALATGVVLAGIAVACFESGPLGVIVLAAIVLGLATGETFGALRASGYQTVSLVGIVAVPALVVATYLRGPEAVPVVLAAALLLAGGWRLTVASDGSTVDDVATTLLVTVWFGVAGAFAGLLVNPSAFGDRHGVAYLGAAVFLTVAHDVGSYLVGSKLGRHRLAPRVSPGKTVEGLIGGTVLTLIVAGAVVSFVHPFSVATALALGVVVAVFAPFGDLVESVVKRDLGMKDMGRLLPAHGGVADRIDALAFVLPATWVLVRLMHIG